MTRCLRMQKTLVQVLQLRLTQLLLKILLPLQLLHILPTMIRYLNMLKTQVQQRYKTRQQHTKQIPQQLKTRLHLRKLVKVPLQHTILYSLIL